MSVATRIKRKIWTIAFSQEAWIKKTGDFRERESYGLIGRPHYIYGMLRAADNAKYLGKKSVTAVEMGVASGYGLLNMIECADLITKETGITFNIVGFDTGIGLPSVDGHKDHPEIWNPGDFAMEDRDALIKKMSGRADIVWGDIGNTIGTFTDQISERSPLGFVSIDVDIYSATKSGLQILTSTTEKYLPAVSIYFDDVRFFTANKWCGELAAIEEFNQENEHRKIDIDRSLPGRRPQLTAPWYSSMYACHVLDHESRTNPRQREKLAISDHYKFIANANLT